jgi:O-antigen/teichoic acid export membrane protein
MTSDLEKSLNIVATGAGTILVGLILGNFLGIICSVLTARFLGVSIYGTFNLAFTIVTIASAVAAFGLYGAISRFIPYYLERGDRNTVRSIIRFSLGFVLCISLSMGFILYLFSTKIAIDIFHENDLLMILPCFALSLPIFTLPTVYQAIIRAYKAAKYQLLIQNIGTVLIRTIIFIPFIFIGYTLFGAIFALISSTIFGIIASIIIIQKKLFLNHSKYTRVPVARKLFSFSLPLYFSDLTFILESKINIIFLGYYLSAEEVGLFVPPLTISSFLLFISNSFEYIFLPVVSEFFSNGKIDNLEQVFKTASKWSILLVVPGFLFFVLFPKEIISFLFGSDYSSGYIALVILTIGISMNIFTGLTGTVLVGGGHTTQNLLCEIFAALTNISLCLVLIPIYGIIGAAFGVCISYFVRNLAQLAFVFKSTKIHPYSKVYIKIGLVSGVVLGIIFLMKIYLASVLFWPILMIFLGLLLVFLFIILLFITHSLDKNDLLILEIIEKKFGIKFNFIRRFI